MNDRNYQDFIILNVCWLFLLQNTTLCYFLKFVKCVTATARPKHLVAANSSLTEALMRVESEDGGEYRT